MQQPWDLHFLETTCKLVQSEICLKNVPFRSIRPLQFPCLLFFLLWMTMCQQTDYSSQAKGQVHDNVLHAQCFTVGSLQKVVFFFLLAGPLQSPGCRYVFSSGSAHASQQASSNFALTQQSCHTQCPSQLQYLWVPYIWALVWDNKLRLTGRGKLQPLSECVLQSWYQNSGAQSGQKITHFPDFQRSLLVSEEVSSHDFWLN